MNETIQKSYVRTLTLNVSLINTPDTALRVLSTLTTFVCVCGMIGNGLVVWLLSCPGPRTQYCTYVLHLAVAGFLFLLCTTITLFLAPTLLAYQVMERGRSFTYTASLTLLTAISMQRCLSVLFPIWYKCHRPQHLSAMVCALLWVLSLLMNVLVSLFCSEFWLSARRCYTVDSVFSSLIMGIFAPVMTLSSVTLFVRVRRSSQQWGRPQPTRLYVVILASVTMFLLCALPLGISWYFLYWLDLPQNQKILFHHMACLSSALSSSANPVIYFVVGSQGRWCLRESPGAILRRVLREEPDGEARETPSTGTNELGA